MTAVTVSSPADHGCESPAAVRPLAFGLAGFFLPGLAGLERELRIQAEGLLVPTWTDAEINRFSLRVGLFVRRGLPELDAELLAERCVARDRSSDWRDMHACAECRHLQDGHRCATFRHGALPLAVLHRCPGFDWQVPRTQGRA